MTVRLVLLGLCALSLGAGPAHAQLRRHHAAAVTPAPRTPPQAAEIPPPSPPPGIAYQVRVEPDTVGIGVPFRVVVRVHAPAGAKVAFPLAPDSGGPVEPLDSRRLFALHDTGATVVAAVYRLAAWDLGHVPVSFGNIAVTDHDRTELVPLGTVGIVVAPTVPARGGARSPRPPRPFYPEARPWWIPWAVAGGVVAVLLIGWLVLRWWRRRSRRAPAPRSALGVAREELHHLDDLGLIEAGEWGRYRMLVVEVVRRYLARRLPTAPLSSTSAELVASLAGDTRVPIERLQTLLTETDLVKFAAYPLTRDAAQAASGAAEALMTDIDTAIVASEVAARDAAARQTSRAFEERRAARAAGHRGRAA